MQASRQAHPEQLTTTAKALTNEGGNKSINPRTTCEKTNNQNGQLSHAHIETTLPSYSSERSVRIVDSS